MRFNSFIQAITKNVRFTFFILSLFLYALWGSPTPDNPGILELVVGVFLVLSVGFTNIVGSVISGISERKDKWVLSITCLFLYGCSIPVIGALMNDVSISAVLRDMVGFLFLCLPLFLVPFIKGNTVQETSSKNRYFLISVLLIGLIFSLRVVFPDFFVWRSSTPLLYLANSPLVLFSALFLFSLALYKVFEKITFQNLGSSIFYLALAAIPFAAMLVDLQRASILAIILTAAFLLFLGGIKAPLKSIFPVIFIAIILVVAFPYLLDVMKNVGVKTSQVGLNMRLQEIYALWDAMRGSWLFILFGQGWGSSFASPAVGELQVTFTHSLLSYVFLKMGLVGLFLTLVYLFFIFEKLLSLYFSSPLKGITLMWPLLIPIFLYASHKSFDFGLVLSLVLLSSGAGNRLTPSSREGLV